MDFKLDILNPLPPVKEDGTLSMDMEDALKKLGGFSRFQLFVMIWLLMIDFPAVMISLNPLLTGNANVPFFCNYKNGTKVEIPKLDLCNFSCPGEILSVGPPYKSIIEEWNLICEKSWIADTMISVQMVGNLVGSISVAYASDRFGRKNAFYINTFFMGITGILCSVSPNPIIFSIARFLSGFAIGASFTSHFNYLMEFLPASWRQVCGCISCWSLGEMMLGLLGYLIPSWRMISWVTAFPAFIILCTVFFIPESPRWAMAAGKTKLAKSGLEQIARWNSKPKLTSGEISLLQSTIAQQRSLENSTKDQSWRAFRDKKLLKILAAFVLGWFANAVVYYGISFNMKNITGDPYWNIFYLGMVDLPAELSGFYFSNRFGRRRTFTTYLLISSVFLVGLVVADFYLAQDYPSAILVLSLIGKFFNEGSWAVMACFTSESFPTICRSFSLSICSAASTIGGIIAPQLLAPYIPKSVPYIIFASLSILSSMVSLTLPEMKNKPLVDG